MTTTQPANDLHNPAKQTAFAKLAWSEWPKVLPRGWSEPRKPLSLGIDKVLKARLPETEHKCLYRLLSKYTNSQHYLAALGSEDSWRHDVDGNPVEPVSGAHRSEAKLRSCARARTKKAETTVAASKPPARPILTLKRPAAVVP